MAFVRALGRKMEDIGRVRHVTANPVGNLFAETALHLGIVPPLVRLAQVPESGEAPIPHRDHYGVLEHFEFARLGKMQTPLPRIPETVWPLAGVAVALVPDVFFRPKPALFPQGQDQFKDVNMPLPLFCFLFDVEDKAASRL